MIQYKPWSDEITKSLTDEAYKGVFSCLDIELGGECPYNCVYCETPYRDKKAKIDIDKICALLDTKQFKWVFICGIGEPTYRTNGKQLLQILKSCEKNDVQCSIFTNLSDLSDLFVEYIKKGILYCLFKFDSRLCRVISELYHLDNLEKYLQNIEKLKQLVQCDGKTTNIAASIVPTKKNLSEIPGLVQWCVDHQIFPLVAQLEYAGLAKEVFEELSLSDDSLCELKIKINELLGEEYHVPFCPSVLAGFCITYDNEIVIDHRTGLSCHSFWLEDPVRDVVCRSISELISVDEITWKVIKARTERYEAFLKNKEQYRCDIFGGCGGNKKDIFDFYIKVMNKAFYSHPLNRNNLKINRFVYLDNNATTKISQLVLDEMEPFLKQSFANPNSNTQLGRNCRAAIERARTTIAQTIVSEPKEIFFTSGGSESNSWAIRCCLANKANRNRRTILSTTIEHESVLDYLDMLKAEGYKIVNIPVTTSGEVDIEALLLSPPKWEDISFATVMLVNNETGVINDIKRLANILHGYNIPIHCDAVQAFGKMRIDVGDLSVDYLSLSGHKIHAPKGVGALYVNKAAYLCPMIFGRQEGAVRGGTENTAYIVALGKAAEIAYSENDTSFEERCERIRRYRDFIEATLENNNLGVIINGKSAARVSNTSNIGFRGIDAIKLSLLLESRGIYISNGAACNTVNPQQSHVLKAMQSPTYETGAIRISLSENTEKRDIEYFLDNLIESIKLIKGE